MAKPCVLIILDGFGISLEEQGNPVVRAETPTLDEIERYFPFTVLQASGAAVGLPWWQAGNSEVGHLTLGAGRIVPQYLPRIHAAIDDKSFFSNPALLAAADHVKTHASRLHIAGLVSSGSVHSSLDHLLALLELASRHQVPEVLLHVFTDGKDAPPRQGASFLKTVQERMNTDYPQARFASIIGRFYAMDRDKNWDRIEQAYRLMSEGRGTEIESAPEYLEACYAKNLDDEFIPPAVLRSVGAPGIIKDNDALIFFNFREDSMREIARAFTEESFDEFKRKPLVNVLVAAMTEYQKGLLMRVAFAPPDIHLPLAQVLDEHGVSHLHIAETEKYAHVTYFFNGSKEEPYPREKRVLIPSLAEAHFDRAPQMRAPEITNEILKGLDDFGFILANFANADLIGHTGNFTAAIRAVETLDQSLGEIMPIVLARAGTLLITADHGNIELKRNSATGERLTQHSMNPVPLYLVGNEFRRAQPRSSEEITSEKKAVQGLLADVAPTVLELLNIKKPDEMTGVSLVGMLTKQV